jgi:hypothetical protein
VTPPVEHSIPRSQNRFPERGQDAYRTDPSAAIGIHLDHVRDGPYKVRPASPRTGDVVGGAQQIVDLPYDIRPLPLIQTDSATVDCPWAPSPYGPLRGDS